MTKYSQTNCPAEAAGVAPTILTQGVRRPADQGASFATRKGRKAARQVSKLPEDFRKALVETLPLEELGAAAGAAGEELQMSGHKMAPVNRRDPS